MSRRGIQIAVAVVVVVVAAVWLRSCSGSEDDFETPAGPTATTSAAASGPAVSPGSSTSPSPSASPSSQPSPSVSGPPADDGLPQVTIETPTPGEHARIPVHATGTVVAFEAVARYEVLQDGKVFVNGPLYADKGAPERGRWETDIELPLGTYTLVVFVESPKDGSRVASAEVRFHAG